MQTHESVHGEKPDAQLARYHDALRGMAAELQEFEKRSRRYESEKAKLAERIAELERRHAETSGQLQETAAAAAQLAEVQRELDAERERSGTLGEQLEACEQDLLECQRQKAETAESHALRSEQLAAEVTAMASRLEEALASAEAAATAAEREHANLLAVIAERDAAMARLEDVSGKRETEDAGPAPSVDCVTDRDTAGSDATDGEADPLRNHSLMIAMDGDHEVKHPLCKPIMVIGRSCEADIQVEGPYTSRRHARLFVSNDAVIVDDMGSLNGTIVNDKTVRRRRLRDGDVLDIGGARLRFVKDVEHSTAAAPDSTGAD
jgi:hypothetical protein